MANKPNNVGCGNCGWRGKRVSILLLDADYDEYTPEFGYCKKCGAVVHTTERLTYWRKLHAEQMEAYPV